MTPIEFSLLLALIQASPAIAQTIQLAQTEAITPAQFAALQAARDASIAAYLAATGQH